MMGTLSVEQYRAIQRAEKAAHCICDHTEADHSSRGRCYAPGCRCPSFRAKKVHKYNAKAVVVDGIKFPSRRQANRYAELKVLERHGTIEGLKVDGPETTFKLEVNGILVCTYRADAIYYENHQRVVEDSKGFLTADYRLKRRLMLAVHGIEIRET